MVYALVAADANGNKEACVCLPNVRVICKWEHFGRIPVKSVPHTLIEENAWKCDTVTSAGEDARLTRGNKCHTFV